jgi:hypothetical protein
MRKDFTTWRRTDAGLALFSTAVAGCLATMVPDPRDGRLWRVAWPDGTRTEAMPFGVARDVAMQRAGGRSKV